jgi:pyruvate dehydrogenase E1 component
MGAIISETLQAGDRLAASGIAADVVYVTSPGRLFEAAQAGRGLADAPTWILD